MAFSTTLLHFIYTVAEHDQACMQGGPKKGRKHLLHRAMNPFDRNPWTFYFRKKTRIPWPMQ